MRRRQRLMSIGLCLVALILALTGSASAGGGVIHYWGDYVVDLTEDPDGNPLPYIPDPSSLLGGRLLFEGWLDGSEYAADPAVTMDLISGEWYFTVNAIQEPGGVMQLSGTGESYLDYFGGLGCDEGGGGWLGIFHGVILPNGDFVGNGTNDGCGALEGWGMKHHEEWRGLDPETGAYASRTFYGHFTPPSP